MKINKLTTFRFVPMLSYSDNRALYEIGLAVA